MSISPDVIARASEQGGVVTRPQLLEMGHSPNSIDWLVRSEVVAVVGSGVYRVTPPRDDIDLVRGAVFALPDAVVSHQSAAHLLHFPKLPDLVPTVVVPSHTTHRFPAVTVRRCHDLTSADTVIVEGLPLTNTTRTFFDLARLLTFPEFDSIGESLVIAGRMNLEEFAQVTSRLARRGKPGSKAAHEFLELRAGGDPRATILERKGRAILAAAGLPTPTPQYPIPWHPRRRFDDAYPDVKIAIEWDSRAWHQQRAAMAADRRRDREAAAHGWVVLRFTWDEVTKRPHEIVDAVSALLRERRAS